MKALLVDQIGDAYLDAEKSGKWVDYQAQRRMSSRIDGVLDAANKSVKNGNFEPAIVAGFEILRRNIKLINHNDDSCGYLGGIMNEAMRLLHDIAEQDLNDDSREFFMECCRKRLYDKTFTGWGLHIDFYALLVALVHTPTECRHLIKEIEKDKRLSDGYEAQYQLKFIHKLIEKSDGKKAALEFLMQNLQVEDFRKQAIDNAINAKDFAQAYQLGEDGIRRDEKQRSGYVSTWNACLLKTAQTEGNTERIVTYARRLYYDHYNIEGDFYAILKANVPQDQWSEFALQLAEDALQHGKGELYTEICAKESWHQRLMDYVRQVLDIRMLRKYEDMLLVCHREEVIDCYIRYIWHVMEGYRCRGTYREVCRYLRHIHHLGAGQMVVTVADELRAKYPRCPALLDELEQLFARY